MNEHRPVALWLKPVAFLSLFIFLNIVFVLFWKQIPYISVVKSVSLAHALAPGLFEDFQYNVWKYYHSYIRRFIFQHGEKQNVSVGYYLQLCVKWVLFFFPWTNFKATFVFSTSHTWKNMQVNNVFVFFFLLNVLLLDFLLTFNISFFI